MIIFEEELNTYRKLEEVVPEEEPIMAQVKDDPVVAAPNILITSMSPTILYAYLFLLFFIPVVLIGVNCLSNIQSPDKFAKKPLLIGKES